MSTVLESIRRADFIATANQVEALAACVVEGQQSASTYLSVLVAHTQAKFEKKRKPSARSMLSTIDKVHDTFYPAVLRGVGDEGIEINERNRRATFARTAASDLRYFVKAGGDVRSLDAAEVSKASLRKTGLAVPTGTRAERTFDRAAQTLARAVQRIAKTDPNEARERIAAEMAALEELLATIPAQPRRRRPAKKATRTTRTRIDRTQRVPSEPRVN